jgi:stearoyl-CoA desaturase (delta-9 desaturase)
MYFFTGLGITAGYHRLWSHKSYTANKLLEIVLAFAGAGASQGSILWWSKYHRLHHNKSDTEDDPYGPQKGFIYSHILWIFENRELSKLKTIDVSDLKKNKIVMFQHRFYPIIALACSIGMPLTYYYLFNYNLKNCIYYPIALSRILVWHSTWFVNSLAHSLGTQPYGKSGTSRNHLFTALLTFGEGYHNFHHEFPYDYRNAIKWYQYDPTKWLIEFLYYIGMVNNLQTKDELNKKIINKEKRSKDMTMEQYKNSTENLILYNNNIYDVTDLIQNHPGGSNYIKMILRKDEEFIINSMNKLNNHTQNAYKLLEKCKICKLVQ